MVLPQVLLEVLRAQVDNSLQDQAFLGAPWLGATQMPTAAEEFGFVGAFSLLSLYVLIIVFCVASAIATRDRFSSLVTLGIALTFFLYFAVNMSMVMGLAPVVGVPLPMVSYGGSAMLVLMAAFGIVQSAHVHHPR